MSEAGAFKVFVALHVADYASSHLLHFSNLAAQAGQNVQQINNKLKIMGGLAQIMIGGLAVAAVNDLVKKSIEAGTELQNVERVIRSIGGITPAIFQDVSKQGWDLGNKFMWTTQADRLKVFGDIHTVFGNAGEARANWDNALQFQTAMMSINPNQSDRDMLNAFKAAELMSAASNPNKSISPAVFQKNLDMIERIYVGSNKMVDPNQMFSMLSQAKYLRMSLSNEAIYKLAAVASESKGSLTGTGFQAVSRAVLAGKLGNATTGAMYAEQMEKLGMLYDITERSKSGAPKIFKVLGYEQFAKDPVYWMENVLKPHMLAHGVDPNNKANFINSLGHLFGSQVAGGMIYQVLSQPGKIHKDASVFKGSAGVDTEVNMFKQSAQANWDMFHASLKDLFASIGENLLPVIIPAVYAFSHVLRSFGDMARSHPILTNMLIGGAGLTGFGLIANGLATIIGTLASSGPLAAGITALAGLVTFPEWGTLALIGGGIAGAIALIANHKVIFDWMKNLWHTMVQHSPILKLVTDNASKLFKSLADNKELWNQLTQGLKSVSAALRILIKDFGDLFKIISSLSPAGMAAKSWGQLEGSVAHNFYGGFMGHGTTGSWASPPVHTPYSSHRTARTPQYVH